MFKKQPRNIVKVREAGSKRKGAGAASSSVPATTSPSALTAPTSSRALARAHDEPTAKTLNVRLVVCSAVILAVVVPAGYFVHAFQVRRTSGDALDRARQLAKDGKSRDALTYVRRREAMEGASSLETLRIKAEIAEDIGRGTIQGARNLAAIHAEILARDSSDVKSRRRLAQVTLKLQAYKDAGEHAQDVLDVEPADADALEVKAEALFLQEKYAEATQAAYRKLVEAHPDKLQGFVRLATCLVRDKKAEKATPVIDDMVAKNPKSGEAYFQRYQFEQNELDGGDVEDLSQAARLEPDNGPIQLAVADRAIADRRWQKAEAAYNLLSKRTDLDQDLRARVYLGLGNLHYSQKQYAKAFEVWQEGLSKTGSSNLPLSVRLAQARVDRGDYDIALQQIDTIRNLVRKEFQRQGQRAKDIARIEQAVNWLEGNCLLLMGNVSKAMPLLRAAGGTGIEDSETAFSAWYRLAGAYATMEQWDAASDCLERAAEIKKNDQGVRLTRAKMLVRAGRIDEAHGVLTTLSTTSERLSPDAAYELAYVRLLRESAKPRDGGQRNWASFDQALAGAWAANAGAIDAEYCLRAVDLVFLQANRLAAEDKQQVDAQSAQNAPNALATAHVFNTAALLKSLRRGISGLPVATVSGLIRGNLADAIRAATAVMVPEKVVGNAEMLLAAGSELLEAQNKKPEMQRLLKTTLHWFADSPSLLRAMVNAYVHEGKLDEAVALIDSAIPRFSGADKRRFLRAKLQIVLAAKDPAKRLEMLLSLGQQAGDDANILLQVCEPLIVANKTNEANDLIAALEKIEGKDGTYWRYCRARQHLSKKESDVASAAALSAQIAQQRPGWGRGHLLAAEIAFCKRDSKGAIRALKEAIRFGERRPDVYRQLLALLASQGEYDDADAYLSQLKQSLLAEPSFLPIALQVSTAQKDHAQALALAKRAVADHPDDSFSHIWLGHIYAVSNEPASAEAEYKKAIEVGPSDLSARLALMRFYVAQGKLDSAQQSLAALKTSPALGERPKLVLAHAAALVGENEEARAYYKEAIAAHPNDASVYRNAASFFLTRNLPEAEATIKKMQALAPDDPLGRQALATYYGRQKDAESWMKALSIVETFETIPELRLRAELHTQLGGPDNRKLAIKEFEQIVSTPGAALPSDRLTLARLYNDEGKNDKALEQMLGLVSNRQASPGELRGCALLLIRAGKFAEAGAMLNRLEEAPGNDPVQAAIMRARLLHASKQSDAALKLLDDTLKANEGKENEAVVLAEVGELLEEMEFFERASMLFDDLVKRFPAQYGAQVQFLARRSKGDRAVEICLAHAREGDSENAAVALALASSVTSWTPVGEAAQQSIDALLQERLKSTPGSLVLTRTLGVRRFRTGNYKEAVKLFQVCADADPKDFDALNNYALALSKFGEHRRAEEMMGRAIAVAGPKLQLLDSQGLVQLESGNVNGALQSFFKVTSDRNASAVNHLHMAAAYARSNGLREAKVALDAARAKGLDRKTLGDDDLKMLEQVEQKLNIKSNR